MTPDAIVTALKAYEVELSAILSRFHRSRDSISMASDDVYRTRQITTEVLDLLRDHVPGSGQHIALISNAYNEGVSNYIGTPSYACVQEIRADISAVITRIERNPSFFAEALSPVGAGPDQRKLLEAVDQLVLRFHAVVVQLRSRREERPTLDVNDEYDVQDLMHALLRLYFDDVRPEEWVPSYAGSASRTDFLLPAVDTVIEVKKTRQGLNAKAIGEQLIIDIARYKQHPQCRRLICFVYDPEGRVTNPAGVESDLNETDHGIEVRVSILPKAT
jgi:hypothetical protein